MVNAFVPLVNTPKIPISPLEANVLFPVLDDVKLLKSKAGID